MPKEKSILPKETNQDGWPTEDEERNGVEKTESKFITPEMREALKASFPSEAYKQHDSKKYLTTLKAMYIIERLNDVFGIGRWTVEHSVVKDEPGYILMKGRLVTLGYDCNLPWQYGGHATSGTGKEPADGYKSAITDIISKSSSYLEIGIDMFKGKVTPENKNNQQSKSDGEPVEPIKKIEDIDKFMEIWSGGKLYSGKFVFWNSRKFEASPDQVNIIKQHPKFKSE